MESLARNEDGQRVTADQVGALASWDPATEHGSEIAYPPARVLLQDFTGVPCVVDLVAMRDAMAAFGGDPVKINPLIPSEWSSTTRSSLTSSPGRTRSVSDTRH